MRRQETWLHEENNERSNRGERQSQSGLWGKVDSWFEEVGGHGGHEASGIFKDKRVKNYRRAETSIQIHLKKGEKGSMSVKHTPRAVFVFFMMCVCG